MYGFIYRNFIEKNGIFYNGDPSTLKHTYDSKEAQERRDRNSEYMTTVKIKRPPSRYVDVQFPEKDGETTDEIFNWIKEKKLEPRLNFMINKFLNTYDVTIEGCFMLRREERALDPTNGRKLMAMRDIIEGMFRVTPVKVKIREDKNTRQPVYQDREFSEDLRGRAKIEYEAGGKKYKTGLFGVYCPNFRDTFFQEYIPETGFDLQPWQEDFRLRRGRITLVKASRDGGKSLMSTDFTAEYLFRELISGRERAKDFEIHYYGLTKDNNTTVAKYIKRMAMSLIEHKVVEWKQTRQELVMYDGGKTRVVRFMSGAAEEQGRGQKPNLVVIDEGGFYKDNKVWKIALGHTNIPVIVISTVDSETPRGWFTDTRDEYYKKMRGYEPIDQLIHRIRKKYGLDKITKREDMIALANNGTIDRARTEFYNARPYVALLYTIDDIHEKVMPQEVKDEKINAALMESEEYMLAEYYGELYNSKSIFNYDGLIENDMPKKYEYIVVGYDEAEKYDNPAIVAVGIYDNKAYVIRSEIMHHRDVYDRYRYMKEFLVEMERFTSGRNSVKFVCDVTRADSLRREIEKEVREIDCPVKYTKGGDVNKKEWPIHKVGKVHLVTLARDRYFKTGNIIFSNSVDSENGLLSELDNFVRMKNGAYGAKGRKYKDDQVNAMMIALYYCYYEYMKDGLANKSRFEGMSFQDMQTIHNNRQHKRNVDAREKMLDYVVHSKRW